MMIRDKKVTWMKIAFVKVVLKFSLFFSQIYLPFAASFCLTRFLETFPYCSVYAAANDLFTEIIHIMQWMQIQTSVQNLIFNSIPAINELHSFINQQPKASNQWDVVCFQIVLFCFVCWVAFYCEPLQNLKPKTQCEQT